MAESAANRIVDAADCAASSWAPGRTDRPLRAALRALPVEVPERDQPDGEFDRFFALSHDLMSIVDFDGSIRCVNPAFERTVGLSSAALLGGPFLDLVHPDDRGVAAAELRKLLAGAPAIEFEARWLWKYGLYRWIQWNADCSLSDHLIYAVGRDITGRKRTDDNLRRLQPEVDGRTRAKEARRESWELLSAEARRLVRAKEALRKSGEQLRATAQEIGQRDEALEATRTLAQRLEIAEEEERKRLAYDLHDGLMQMIHAIDMHCEAALGCASLRDGAAGGELERMSRGLKEAIHEGRRILSRLRPAALDDFGLVEAARFYLQDIAAQHGWQFQLKADLQGWHPPPHVEATLFRIVQQALANAGSHAQTESVSVAFRLDGDFITAEVRDCGRGFDVEAQLRRAPLGGKLGLVGMQDRARMLAGSCRITSEPGRGTVITAAIPIAANRRPVGGGPE